MTFQSTQVERTERQLGNQQLIVRNLLEHNASDSGQDAVEGLSSQPKSLPSKYFYDEQGSQLFEQICQLREYYPTRTEIDIIKKFGREISQTTGPSELIELGSGSATKARILLNAYQVAGYPLRYLPIDVSSTMLTESVQTLAAEYPDLSVHGFVSTYELALSRLPPPQMPTRMLCFMGSTLGNFQLGQCDEILTKISDSLHPGDYFLLGIDLQKEISILEAAYNDSENVTAAFNLNMLNHLNRRFDGDFELKDFEHVAYYNQKNAQIEMYLRSLKAQYVCLNALDFSVSFEKNELILSEISRKFNLNETSQLLTNRGFSTVKVFVDRNQWFSLLLCRRVM